MVQLVIERFQPGHLPRPAAAGQRVQVIGSPVEQAQVVINPLFTVRDGVAPQYLGLMLQAVEEAARVEGSYKYQEHPTQDEKDHHPRPNSQNAF